MLHVIDDSSVIQAKSCILVYLDSCSRSVSASFVDDVVNLLNSYICEHSDIKADVLCINRDADTHHLYGSDEEDVDNE